MSQQMHEQPQRPRPRWRERLAQEQPGIPAAGQQMSNNAQEAGEQLKKLDASIDEYLANPVAAGPSVVVGDQQRHQVESPTQNAQEERYLSDERLVRGFHQTTGE